MDPYDRYKEPEFPKHGRDFEKHDLKFKKRKKRGKPDRNTVPSKKDEQ